MHKIVYSFFLIIFAFSKPLFAAEDVIEKNKIVDFYTTWVHFDTYYEAYLPTKLSALTSFNSLHQELQTEKVIEQKLYFWATKELSVFVNHKLVYRKISEKEEMVIIPFSTLVPSSSGELLLSFYHPDKVLPLKQSGILSGIEVNSKEEVNDNLFILNVRDLKSRSTALALLFVLMIALVVTLKYLYPKEFTKLFSIYVQEVSENMPQKAFTVPTLLMNFIVGISLSMMVYLFKLDVKVWGESNSLFAGVLIVVFCYFGFVILRYFYISIMAWLFNYLKIVDLQFSEYIRLFEKISFFASIITYGFFMSGFSKFELSPEILNYLLILVLTICLLKVILLFFRLIPHRNLYLFSYLCAAEILPLIVAVKILLL